ncbi:hypothetical protein NX722_23550 [Endozoicomonas gorgoniicola]|uniref:Uncharacterized protein n=1 Tax=Endozoicomonas gorgoniicola TaxID=1234144 RepID=A0ABT3N1M9_9GAMM|nr:hypothetical protein [Endozoicomonas gorgoniicola]MCW7555543.1 hypothetical protein [Endozoicomonas gorgoniicola]
MNKTLATLTLIPVLILMGASIALTALLVSAMAPEGWMEWPAAITGGALQLCQFGFIPLGFLLLRKRNCSGWLFLVIGFLLFLVSNGASVAFLEYSYQKRVASSETVLAQQKNKERKDRISDLAILAAQQDIESKVYRGRGVETLKEVVSIQESNTRDTAVTETVASSSPFIAFAALTGITSDRARAIAWWLMSFLMDVCATAGSVALTLFRPQQRNATPEAETPETPAQQNNEAAGKEASNYIVIHSAIKSQLYGNKPPSLRNVMKETGWRYPKVKALYDQLEQEGIIRSLGKGRGYEYINPQ